MTSMVALTLYNAHTDDDRFAEWLQTLLTNSLGGENVHIPPQTTVPTATTGHQPAATTPPAQSCGTAPTPARQTSRTAPPPQGAHWPAGPATWPAGQQAGHGGHTSAPPYAPPYTSGVPPIPPGIPPPPADMWAHIAANLTQGLASMAAAIAPAQTAATMADPSTLYNQGGRDYDEFQVAILKGFAHTSNIDDIPSVWQLFQQSKHIEGHRDLIKCRMIDWARNTTPDQVNIDRGLFLSNTSIKDILALCFNPEGPTAEVATADQGLSILICRPLTADGKAALRRRELLEATTKRRTLAEAELELTQNEPTTFPDDFNKLHFCLGTSCALLHALFGDSR